MSTASAPRAPSTRRIGRYDVTGRVGRGGMGMVWSGHDPVLDRAVAVKTLSVEATLDVESRQRFEIEARAAARLQHPNIVTVYELGEDRNVPFIAMELLHGSDLESVRRSGLPLSLPEILDITIQVARGLAFAHEHGIVHRDIKPTNVRLLDDGGVKIMDFGIAKLGGTNLTRHGMMVGTVYYMSPEQVQAKPLDGRSDVFSLGVILHELLTERRPFEAETTTQILYKIVHGDARRLEGDFQGSGPALVELVSKALARDPEARHASASHFADAVATILAAHLAAWPPGTTPEDLEGVAEARLHLRAGRVAEAQAKASALIEARPGCVEARRMWRAAHRPQRAADADLFLDLDATFEGPKTEQQAITGIEVAPIASSSRRFGMAAAAVLLALGAGAWLLKPGPRPALGVAPATTEASAASELPVPLGTGPAAAKPLEAARPSRPSVRPASGPAAVTPGVPNGTVTIRSAYPIDVAYQGRVLARGTSAVSVEVPVGRQSLSLVSDAHSLRRSVSVEVKATGSAIVDAPALGRVSIKANPDNCEVSIDGVFVDYPPILDRALAEGTHTISFKWSDGVRRDEAIEIVAGRLAYVTGRKD